MSATVFAFKVSADGRVKVREGTELSSELVDTEVDDIELEVVLSNDADWDTPRPRLVTFHLRRYHAEDATSRRFFHVGVEADLTFKDLERLHAFLDLLLRCGPLESIE